MIFVKEDYEEQNKEDFEMDNKKWTFKDENEARHSNECYDGYYYKTDNDSFHVPFLYSLLNNQNCGYGLLDNRNNELR